MKKTPQRRRKRKKSLSHSAATRKAQPMSLVDFFRKSPLRGLKLDFDRDPDTGRDIDL
jgi:hypothetical protein